LPQHEIPPLHDIEHLDNLSLNPISAASRAVMAGRASGNCDDFDFASRGRDAQRSRAGFRFPQFFFRRISRFSVGERESGFEIQSLTTSHLIPRPNSQSQPPIEMMAMAAKVTLITDCRILVST
jgi:hypothetical protein